MNVLRRYLAGLIGSPALTTIVCFVFVSLSLYTQASSQIQSTQTKKLSASEMALVQSSRSAIIGTGISSKSFDQHFGLIRVIDQVSDRRVIWKYSIGEYETTLNDAVGYYADEKGRRINIHAVRNYLSASHDIENTIPKKRAEKLMLQCIGKYSLGPVLFQSFGPTLRASLILSASSLVMPRERRGKDERRESAKDREEKDERKPAKAKSTNDSTEEGDEEEGNGRPLVITGYIDLETGMCTKGIAQADHPVPVK